MGFGGPTGSVQVLAQGAHGLPPPAIPGVCVCVCVCVCARVVSILCVCTDTYLAPFCTQARTRPHAHFDTRARAHTHTHTRAHMHTPGLRWSGAEPAAVAGAASGAGAGTNGISVTQCHYLPSHRPDVPMQAPSGGGGGGEAGGCEYLEQQRHVAASEFSHAPMPHAVSGRGTTARAPLPSKHTSISFGSHATQEQQTAAAAAAGQQQQQQQQAGASAAVAAAVARSMVMNSMCGRESERERLLTYIDTQTHTT